MIRTLIVTIGVTIGLVWGALFGLVAVALWLDRRDRKERNARQRDRTATDAAFDDIVEHWR